MRQTTARIRGLAVAALIAVFAVVGLLTLDRDTSDAQTPTTPFAFSSASVSAIQVEVDRKPDYTAPTLQGVGPGYSSNCYQATVSVSAPGGLNGLHVNGYQTPGAGGKIGKPGLKIKIKGRPTAVAATRTYTVTATCTFAAAGKSPAPVSYTIDIEAIAKQVEPMAFASNSKGHVKLLKDSVLGSGGANAIINPPSLSGDKVGTVTYSISPTSLPGGLSFNTSNGKITGTPNAVAAKQTYTVTATDSTVGTPQTSTFTIDLEVIDLRSLLPWDRHTVLESVKKTNKVILLHEATRTGGFAGELAAVIAEEAFEHLDGPIRRITAPDTPVPYSPPMEEFFLPQVSDVVRVARELNDY